MSLYSTYVLSRSPVAYWRLGDAAGNPQDSSGNARHMTANAGLTYGVTGAIAGDTDKAMTFDGATSYASMADDAAFDFAYNANFSVVLWYTVPFPLAPAAYARLVTKDDNTAPYPWMWRVSSSAAYPVFLRSDGTYTPSAYKASSVPWDGNWHMLAAVKSGGAGGNITAYFDGVPGTPATDTTTGTTANAVGVQIGRDAGPDHYFLGSLDEISVHGAALTASQIAEMYTLGLLGTNPRGPQGPIVFNPAMRQRTRLIQ